MATVSCLIGSLQAGLCMAQADPLPNPTQPHRFPINWYFVLCVV